MFTTLTALIAGCLAGADSVQAEYGFEIGDPSEGRVECHLRLEGVSGPFEIALPERFAFASPDEPRLLGEVEVGDGQGMIERLDAFTWRVEPSGGVAELNWIVPLDHRSLPIAQRSSYELPYLDAEHGFLATATLALAPLDLEPAGIRVRLNLPEGWDKVVPWPEVEAGVFAPRDWRQLQNDLIAVGAWDVTRFVVGGVDLAIAFAPGQASLGKDLAERIGPIIECELELFGRVPNPTYAFFFGKPGMNGLGGSVKSTSMTLLVGPNMPADIVAEHIGHLIAHEYHHTWMFSLETRPDEDELHFVTEGFTDYFAHLVSWWMGFVEDSALLATLGEKLAEYEQSQFGRERTLIEAGGQPFYEDPSAYSAVYSGGLVLALLTELAIDRHDAERDLAALLRELYNGPVGAPGATPGEAPGLDDFLTLLEDYAGEEFAAWARSFVEHPGPLDLRPTFAAFGVPIERTDEPFDLSNLRANLEGTTLAGIDSSDPARLVGLRSGDKLLVVNGREVQSESDVRAAWSQPREGRVQAIYVRDGAEFELDVPVPRDVQYVLPVEVLGALRSDS